MAGTDQHWASVDGERWVRAGRLPAGAASPIEFRVMAAGGPGLILLGESSRPASPDTTLFTSSDGLAWTAIEPPGPIRTDVAVGLVVRGRHLIAVTESFSDDAGSRFRSWTAFAP